MGRGRTQFLSFWTLVTFWALTNLVANKQVAYRFLAGPLDRKLAQDPRYVKGKPKEV